ncbi:MAG: phytanoyl-CoA dioxygenase family protein [Caldilineaceae bacterium]
MTFDQKFWEEQGYIVIRNAVPPAQLQAVVAAMTAYTGKDLADPAQWYDGLKTFGGGGMINLAHDQALWETRQAPSIYEAYAAIWGTEKLWVTLNRTNFNPPFGPQWDHAGFIHWDLDVTHRPLQSCVQGVLYLTDTAANMGGFQCVPGSHRRLAEWVTTHDPDDVPTVDAIREGLAVEQIVGQAGDLVIWTQALLHGNGKNTSSTPRLAQYICMTPEGTARSPRGLVDGGEELRRARVDSWRDGPYQAAVAAALGVPEGLIEAWLRALLQQTDESPEVPPLPSGSKLRAEQQQRLLDLIATQQPWRAPTISEALHLQKAYGTTASYLPKARLAKEIAALMTAAFDTTFAVEPAALSPLGRKLLGVEAW